MINLQLGDCLEVLRTLPDNSVDAVVTDPPYGLSFMGKKWDYDVPSVEVWAECLRVLKPGGHLLAFAGTRTQHRMAVRIEDAGFEIRDMIAWVYGSGFPKSHDVSKAIDREAGAEREVVGKHPQPKAQPSEGWGHKSEAFITAPATEAAKQWQGWGTALKPALEPITVARKPLIGTVAENVLEHGTGALNVDGCRVEGEARPVMVRTETVVSATSMSGQSTGATSSGELTTVGRWPANLIHDGSEEVVALFPQSVGQQGAVRGTEPSKTGDANCYGEYGRVPFAARGDGGSAARFFYCAKASKRDRDEGLVGYEEIEVRGGGGRVKEGYSEETKHLKEAARKYGAVKSAKLNTHPTVKPTDLMRYLCRLVTPPGGVVLDPFMGSGSTGKSAVIEGFSFIGIEREAEYIEIAKARINAVNKNTVKQESLF